MAKIKTKEVDKEEMDLEEEWDKLESEFKNEKGELVAPDVNEITVTKLGGSDGFDNEDVSFPKLQIAQGVGPFDLYPKGSIVLDKEMEIAKMDSKPVEITVLRW